MATRNLRLTRDQLAVVAHRDPETTKQLEKLFSYVNGLLTGALTGNVIWVDIVNGSDASGTSGDSSLAFATVGAALAAAVAGDVVMLRPGVYEEANPIILPDDVALIGFSHSNTTIQMSNVATSTVLLTMGENSSVENLDLRLTAAGHQTLTGVLFPVTTTATATLRRVDISVDNSGASDAGTSVVTGVHVMATSTPAKATTVAMDECSVAVESAGLGTKRAILLDTSTATMRCADSFFSCSRTGAGAGSYIGAECNRASALLDLTGGAVQGFSADISQTAGQISVVAVELVGNSANALGFTVAAQSPLYTWGVSGAIAAGTRYLYPGTNAESANEVQLRMRRSGILHRLSLHSRVAPGAGKSDVFTVRKNGVATALTVTLANANVNAEITTVSVSFNAGDLLSVEAVTAAGSASQDVVIMTEVY